MTETVIKIKTSLFSDKPTTLREGELAYSFTSGILYIGGPNNTIKTVTSPSTLSSFNLGLPDNPSNGDVWLDTTNNQLNIYRNGSWDRVVFKNEAASDFGGIIINAGYF